MVSQETIKFLQEYVIYDVDKRKAFQILILFTFLFYLLTVYTSVYMDAHMCIHDMWGGTCGKRHTWRSRTNFVVISLHTRLGGLKGQNAYSQFLWQIPFFMKQSCWLTLQTFRKEHSVDAMTQTDQEIGLLKRQDKSKNVYTQVI